MLILVIAIFAVLLVIGAPILLCLGLPPVIWLLSSSNVPNLVYGQKMFAACDSFALMAVPFFMLSGQIMERTGITEDIIKFADACIGWLKGGLGHTVELAGILLAGLSGSSNADTAALGAICLQPLKKLGFEDGWAESIIVSAGSIGPIIPPSIVMVVYANAAGLNIGKLFMGGVIPGIILGLGYMSIVYIYAKKRNIPVTPFGGWKNLWKTFKIAVWALLMPLIIIGGILLGIFTATEAGVAATLYGIAYGFIRRKINLKDVWNAIGDAVISSAGPVSLIAISSMFSYMLARLGVISAIENYCKANISTPQGVTRFVIVICFIAGCFVDGTAVMLLLAPIVLPIIQSMGGDVQNFSIIFMIAIMSGGMTPPVGSQLFVVSALDNCRISRFFKTMPPFLGIVICTMLIMIAFPALTDWLPAICGYS